MLEENLTIQGNTAEYRWSPTSEQNIAALKATHDPNIEIHTRYNIVLGFLLEGLAKRVCDELEQRTEQEGLVLQGMFTGFKNIVHTGDSVRVVAEKQGRIVRPHFYLNGTDADAFLDKKTRATYCLPEQLPPTESFAFPDSATSRLIRLSPEDVQAFYGTLEDPINGRPPVMYAIARSSEILGAELERNEEFTLPEGQRIVYGLHKIEIFRPMYDTSIGDCIDMGVTDLRLSEKAIRATTVATNTDKEKLFSIHAFLFFVDEDQLKR